MDDDYRARVLNGQVAVAMLEELPVGLIVTVLASDHLFVENVAVDPAHHGRGAGGALLRHAEDLAERAGVPEVRLYTNAAMVENLAMYAKRGYEERERRHEDGFDRVYFVKRIGRPPPAAPRLSAGVVSRRA
jgi:ribosomal protein S18 acetylase RimI-like enzyme